MSPRTPPVSHDMFEFETQDLGHRYILARKDHARRHARAHVFLHLPCGIAPADRSVGEQIIDPLVALRRLLHGRFPLEDVVMVRCHAGRSLL